MAICSSPRYPLFPFGFGLSYTTFEIGAPQLSATRLKAGQPLSVHVEVRNTGTSAGDEVVQLYLHHLVSSVTRPVRSSRVSGASRWRRVSAPRWSSPDRDAFGYWNEHMKDVVEPGGVEIMVGANSVDLKRTTLEIEP